MTPTRDAPLEEVLEFALAHAVLAPSEHNSQPWRFDLRTTGGQPTVDVLLDRSRHLDAVDPSDREARLACGAAVLNLRLGLAGAGRTSTVSLPEDPDRPDVVATVTIGSPGPESPLLRELRLAVPERTTTRGPLDSTPLPLPLLVSLVAEGSREGGFVTLLDPAQRAVLVELTSRAEEQLRADPAYRREAAAWSRTDDSRRRDGVPAYAAGDDAVRSWLLTAGPRPAGRSPQLLAAAPAVVVVSSPDDRSPALVRAGASMQRLLLRATAAGVRTSFANASLHVPSLRADLADRLDIGHPQVVLRLGYGPATGHTPRRRVQESLVPHVRPGRTYVDGRRTRSVDSLG